MTTKRNLKNPQKYIGKRIDPTKWIMVCALPKDGQTGA